MGTPRSVRALVAVTLIALGVVVPLAYSYWLSTPIFEPLNVPISLKRGHVRTGDFYLNFPNWYWVYLKFDYAFTYSHPECEIDGPNSVVKTHFALSRAGRAIEEFDGEDYWHVVEAGRKGYYRLDVDVLSDASCADAAHPRLVMSTSPGTYEEVEPILRWLTFCLVLGGLGLLATMALERADKRRSERRRIVIVEPSEQGHSTWPVRFPPAKLITGLPHFGLVCGTVIGILVMIMMYFEMDRPIPKGLLVSLAGREQPTRDPVLHPPIIVRIETTTPRGPSRVFVNSKPVEWKDLSSALTGELKTRSEWVVYVDGDPNLPWFDVVNAVDAIRGVHARAVLLGSK